MSKIQTRYWDHPDGLSNTAVQVVGMPETAAMVFMHSNIGWLPISNAPASYAAAEVFAEEMAKGYGLEERSQQFALYMVGDAESEDD